MQTAGTTAPPAGSWRPPASSAGRCFRARLWPGAEPVRPGVQGFSGTPSVYVVALLLLGPVPVQAADVALGQYLASECATCHRADGETKGIPAIVGWPSEQFVAALKAYRDKARPNPIMQSIAASLGDGEMAALAAYYERLPKPD